MNDAQKKGYDAYFWGGSDWHECPYTFGSKEWEDWQSGRVDAIGDEIRSLEG